MCIDFDLKLLSSVAWLLHSTSFVKSLNLKEAFIDNFNVTCRNGKVFDHRFQLKGCMVVACLESAQMIVSVFMIGLNVV